MIFAAIAYIGIALAIAVKDYRKPHSETFSRSQHLRNSVIGAILWPAGAMLLAVAFIMGVWKWRTGARGV